MVNYLSVEEIGKSYNEQELFSNITLGIAQGQKVALVGKNGCGKSTLLKIIAGKEDADTGLVVFRKDIKVSYLPQNPEFDEWHSIREAVFDQDNEVLSLISRYEDALKKGNNDLSDLIHQIDSMHAWDYEAQIEQILSTFHIHDLSQPVTELSGGQRKRIALAKVLIEKPDLLIMDEPTNHLDLEIIEWLEDYLSTQNLALLLVTHDRYFLEKVTNEIIELDQGQLYSYKGNYSYFLEKKAERMQNAASEIQKARGLMVKELDWIRRQPKARGTKAKYRVDAFDSLKEKASTKIEDANVQIRMGMQRLGNKIMEIEQLNKSWDNLKIAENFTYFFKRKDKIGIIGKNGTGKSSFLNIITGSDQKYTGKITKGETVKIGYFKQEDPGFDPQKRIIDIVKEVAEAIKLNDGSTISASQFLQHFLFPPHTHYTPVEKLSGGEKKRLQLLRILMDNPNFLILDEPTNDLDIYTLNVLEEFLLEFEGVLIVVSHDRFFMDRLTHHSFVFRGNGDIEDFPGNYSQFREVEIERIKAEQLELQQQKEKSNTTQNQKVKQENKKKLSYKEQREYEELEREIERLEQSKAGLVEKMNSISDHIELNNLGEQLKKVDHDLEIKSERWFELASMSE